jgi:CRISPR-associated protein (Cas_Cas02710).
MGLPLWTFIGIGVSALLFNAVGDLIEAFVTWCCLGAKPSSLLPSLLLCAVVLFFVAFGVYFHSRHPEGVSTMDSRRVVSQKQGLIFLVSRLEPAQFAIRHHAGGSGPLRRLWLVPSQDDNDLFGRSTRPVAEEINAWCKNEFPSIDVEIRGVAPGDAQETFDIVNRIFRSSGFASRDVVADFTGGVKPMSVGMVMACLPTERELEYIVYDQAGKMSGPYLIDYQHSAFDLVG